MNRLATSAALVLIFTAASLPALSGRNSSLPSEAHSLQQQNNTPLSYAGEITDNACAVHASHDAMIKKEGFKNAKECTLGCVKDGAKFVLYAPANGTTYQLEEQDKVSDFAGQKVTIIGTYNGETKTIHIQSIQVAP
jgi:hypothetical protein